MKKGFKIFFAIVIFIAVISTMIYNSMKPIEVEVTTVKFQDIQDTFKEEGIVESSQKQYIHTSLNGEVTELNISEGQMVKKGSVLVKIDTKDLDFQIEQLQGQLESSNGQYAQNTKDPYDAQIKQQELQLVELERQLTVYEKEYQLQLKNYQNGLITIKELDKSKEIIEQTRNSILQQEQAQKLIKEQNEPEKGTREYFDGLKKSLNAQIDHIKYQKTKSEILAPYDGIVSNISIKKGSQVSPQTQLMGICMSDSFVVQTYLLPEDAINIKIGSKVKLIQKRKDEDCYYGGEVSFIAASAEEKVSSLGLIERKIKINIIPTEEISELKIGYPLDVEFTAHSLKSILAVPKLSIFPYEGSDAVFTVQNNKAKIKKIKRGLKTDELIVVTEGLKSKDVIIKNPQMDGLKDGSSVLGLN